MIGILTALCVFLHGQLDNENYWKGPLRIACTVIVVLIFGYLGYMLAGLVFALVSMASTALAFTSGPHIGWDKDVRRTQFIKGLWLAAPLFPVGLLYAFLRPLSYWVGYTTFTAKQDVISRALSGVFLGLLVTVYQLLLCNLRGI